MMKGGGGGQGQKEGEQCSGWAGGCGHNCTPSNGSSEIDRQLGRDEANDAGERPFLPSHEPVSTEPFENDLRLKVLFQ